MIFRRKRSKAQLILAYVLTSISGVKRRESSRREAWRRLISGYNKVRRTVFLTSLTLSGFEFQLVYKQKRNRFCDSFFRGALQGTRTPDLLVRSQTLYPAELAAHFLVLIYYSTEFSKIKCFFKKVQIFIFCEYTRFYERKSLLEYRFREKKTGLSPTVCVTSEQIGRAYRFYIQPHTVAVPWFAVERSKYVATVYGFMILRALRCKENTGIISGKKLLSQTNVYLLSDNNRIKQSEITHNVIYRCSYYTLINDNFQAPIHISLSLNIKL